MDRQSVRATRLLADVPWCVHALHHALPRPAGPAPWGQGIDSNGTINASIHNTTCFISADVHVCDPIPLQQATCWWFTHITEEQLPVQIGYGRPHSNITIINNIHSVTRQRQVNITNTSRLHGKPDEGTHEHVETIKQVTQHNIIHGEKS